MKNGLIKTIVIWIIITIIIAGFEDLQKYIRFYGIIGSSISRFEEYFHINDESGILAWGGIGLIRGIFIGLLQSFSLFVNVKNRKYWLLATIIGYLFGTIMTLPTILFLIHNLGMIPTESNQIIQNAAQFIPLILFVSTLQSIIFWKYSKKTTAIWWLCSIASMFACYGIYAVTRNFFVSYLVFGIIAIIAIPAIVEYNTLPNQALQPTRQPAA